MSSPAIDSFMGEYRYLSNYHYASVMLDGIEYPTNEHAYQAAKTIWVDLRKRILPMTPREAKRYGRTLPLRGDWEEIKIDVMFGLIKQKFDRQRHPDLAKRLLETRPRLLVEGNTWHDNFWGNCTCPRCCDVEGKNNLGILLMKHRDGGNK